jgi:lysophospholipase L1-like esterase
LLQGAELQKFLLILKVCIYAATLLVIAELTLQVAALMDPEWDYILSRRARLVPDDVLEYRLSPDHPDHDMRGFRNISIPEKADVVVIGDSQTYGTGVPADQSFPRQLARMRGYVVYSMAAGGYSPPQYLRLYDEATALKPELIVVGLYLGNDLAEAFRFVYSQDWAPDLSHSNPDTADEFFKAERIRPSQPPKNFKGKDDFFKLQNLANAVRRIVRKSMNQNTEERWQSLREKAAANGQFILETTSVNTIFTSSRRLNALDQSSPRNREGLRITLEAIWRLNEKAGRAGIRMLVVLIPTKELVFRRYVLAADGVEPTQTYINLVRNESDLWMRIRNEFDNLGIEYVDPLPELRRALNSGRMIYDISQDGHPRKAGYAAIAMAVAAGIDDGSRVVPENP